jgi:hypothetical protein
VAWRVPSLQVGPAKPESHWHVYELDVLGMQVPCLLQTSDVQTTSKRTEDETTMDYMLSLRRSTGYIP